MSPTAFESPLRETILDHMRQQLGEDNYRALIEGLGEDGAIRAFVQQLPDDMRHYLLDSSPAPFDFKPKSMDDEIAGNFRARRPLVVMLAVAGAVAGGVLAYQWAPGYWWIAGALAGMVILPVPALGAQAVVFAIRAVVALAAAVGWFSLADAIGGTAGGVMAGLVAGAFCGFVGGGVVSAGGEISVALGIVAGALVGAIAGGLGGHAGQAILSEDFWNMTLGAGIIAGFIGWGIAALARMSNNLYKF